MAGIFEALEGAFKSAIRVGQTAGTVAGTLAETGFGMLLGQSPPAPAVLRRTFERLGATYIKLGQFIASSPSLFPADYVEEFQHCLDRTEPLPYSEIRRILRAELGREPEEVFQEIQAEPMASASIAQVHAAKLQNGLDVALKIQKPGVGDILLTDLNFLYVAARVLEWFAPGFARTSLSGIITDVQRTMMEETDFLKEAKNLDEFREFLSSAQITGATAPRVYHEYSTSRLLVMERFYGVPLTDLESIRKYAPEPEVTLINALNTWFASLVMCNFFHADVHAGNLMVLDDGRVGFIDFGIVGRIKKETWGSMNQLMESMAEQDFRGMAESLVGIGATSEEVDVPRFAQDLEELFRSLDSFVVEGAPVPADPQLMPFDEAELNRMMIRMVELGERHGIRFPREFGLLMKQFLYFDRYVRILAPGLDIFGDARLHPMLEG